MDRTLSTQFDLSGEFRRTFSAITSSLCQMVNDLPCESVLPSNVMVSRTPIDCLKPSFWSGSLHPVFVNLGGNQRGPYVARTIICEPLASLVHGREAPHLSISRNMVGFTLVVMSLAACAERETEIRLSEAGHSTRCPR